MLVIKTIKLTGDQVIKPKRLMKVRVGYDKHVCANKKQPRFFQNQTIEWKQDMTLPLFFKKTIEFQFCPSHQFGYNPEQFSSICYAKATIQNFRKLHMETKAIDSNGNVVGQVYFQFSVINDHRAKIQLEIVNKIIISSILAHLNSTQGEWGQIQLKMGDENTCTPQVKIVAGQLTWVQRLTIDSFHDLSQQQQLTARIFVDDNFIGESTMPIKQLNKSGQKYKKFPIHDSKKIKIGILFIDFKIKEIKQSQKNKNRAKSEVNQNLSNLKNASYFPPLTPIKNYRQQKIRSSKSQKKMTPITQRQLTQSSLVGGRGKTKTQINTILAAKLGQNINKEIKPKTKI